MNLEKAPAIAVTAGDPCGIGAEVILKALSSPRLLRQARWIVIGDHRVFERRAARLQKTLPRWRVLHPAIPPSPSLAQLPLSFIDWAHPYAFKPGKPSIGAGKASLRYLDYAVALWRWGLIEALVTAPVTKWAIGKTQPAFIGQTEYLAKATKARDVVMMFVSDGLRVGLLTRHVPLSGVPRAIQAPLLRRTLRTMASTLKTHFGLPRPRIALCGLNPHAGEAGRCGSEEERILKPALRSLRQEGLACEGPFAADGFFASWPRRSSLSARQEQAAHCQKGCRPALRGGFQPVRGVRSHAAPQGHSGRGGSERQRASEGETGRFPLRVDSAYDAVLCAYHDQGLIPFKMAARDRGCQLSAGLPIIRTSPDHGSALDIAGRGIADSGSMRYALRLAIGLARKKREALRKAESAC